MTRQAGARIAEKIIKNQPSQPHTPNRRAQPKTTRTTGKGYVDGAGQRHRQPALRRVDLSASANRIFADFAKADREIKTFLFAHLYRHESVQRVRLKADEMVRALYRAYSEQPGEMGDQWRQRALQGPRERAVADYIAGMTDRFAVNESRRLCDPAANLR